MTMARQKREEFADLLASLRPGHSDAPTLCERWRVRAVAAHVISYDELTPVELVQRFAKGWFVVDRVNAIGVADYADRCVTSGLGRWRTLGLLNDCPLRHRLGPGDMSLEVGRFRHLAVAIPEVRVSRGIAVSVRQ